MSIRIGINGFGRMGRLALRAGWDRPDLEFVHINEVSGGPAAGAHLLTFDSVHGSGVEKLLRATMPSKSIGSGFPIQRV